jgi:cytidylate kinase
MIVAIDGPAGAGKSTIAKIIAQRMGFLYIDTGSMYRALTLKVLESGVDIADAPRIIELAKNSSIDLVNDPNGALKVFLDGRDVSSLIREPRITRVVSDIAKIKEVREVMVKLQRRMGKVRNSVLDGRDIGTVVFPDADKKFFIDANPQERVKRRHKELIGLGQKVSPEEVSMDLANRDKIDSTRAVGPLKKAEDAIYIDTSDLNIEQVVGKVLEYLSQHG